MKKSPDLLMVLASLLLLLLFVLPLWRITLKAPQYPDGISMYIWINKITGDSEYTLQNINILNHYIGMQYIEPDSIPELRYFPIVVSFVVIAGLIMSWLSSGFRLTWVIVMIILSALGVYDFYLWEYDYGHNLSPTAPIKVPGMAYQPPLFGSKMLLNFNAMSYPHWGALALVASIAMGFVSVWRGRKTKTAVSGETIAAIPALMFLVVCIGCSNKPQPINYGYDSCHYCKMTIVDSRFGAKAITKKGKQLKFDAVECLLNYMNIEAKQDQLMTYITPFDSPNTLVESNKCIYLINSEIPSPMGMYLTAYSSDLSAQEHQKLHGGEILGWDGLATYFDQTSINN